MLRLIYVLWMLTALIAVQFRPLQACIAIPRNATLTSGSYADVVELDNYLVLANGSGLEVRYQDRGRAELDPEPIPISGEISQLVAAHNTVFAVVADEGLFRVSLDGDPSDWRERPAFIPLSGVQSVAIIGQYVFANTGDDIQMYEFRTRTELDLLDTWTVNANKVLAFDNIVAVATEDSEVFWRRFDGGLFAPDTNVLEIAGQNRFFQLELQDLTHTTQKRLVVRTNDSILWAGFDESGRAGEEGVYFKNNARDLVFAWSVAGNDLYLRFADRLEMRNVIDESASLQLAMETSSLAEVGVTRLRAVNDHIYFIYEGNQDIKWSLRSYKAIAGQLVKTIELKSPYGDISSVAVASEYLFFASVNGLYSAGVATDFVQQVNPREAKQFTGTIQSITGNGNVLYVVTSEPDSGRSTLTALSVDEQGKVTEILEESFPGALETITVYNNSVGILQVSRTYQGRHYTAYVVDQAELVAGNVSFENAPRYTESTPFEAAPSFLDFTMTRYGLMHHNKSAITLHPSLENLSLRTEIDLGGNESFQTMIVLEEELWIQTDSALFLYELNGEQAGLMGSYSNWYGIQRLTGNEIIAQNKQDPSPGRYYTLDAAENGLVQAVSSFRSSSRPLFADDTRDAEPRMLFTVETSSLRSYEVECKENSDRYLFPFLRSAELEVSTDLGPTDQINFTIFNIKGEIIGFQRMDSDLISFFNGRTLNEWIYEYNDQDEPYTVVLYATKPIAPILSAQNNDSPNSRYAYRVPSTGDFTTDIYMPHVPDHQDWLTTMYLQNSQPSGDDLDVITNKNDSLTIELQNSSGERLTRQVPIGGTDIFDIGEALFEKDTSWAKISSFDLSTRLAGFGLIRRRNQSQAAAIPLINSLSEVLVVPYIAGSRNPNWWTGIVMSNPNEREAVAKILAFGADGQPLSTRTIEIPARSRLVDLAEAFYDKPFNGEGAVWMAIASSERIMGMVMYGDVDNNSLAALPLSYVDGRELLFSGIRENDLYWSRILLTNIDPDPTVVTLTALDNRGETVAVERLSMPRRGHLELPIHEFFERLSPHEIASIRTVHVTSDSTNLFGFLLRGRQGTDSLEAASALHVESDDF